MTSDGQVRDDGPARRLCVLVLPLLVVLVCGVMGARIRCVAQGGDAPAYLLAARYDPLLDNFDNPAHGWGYPALIKLATLVVGDEYVAARAISALAAGLLVFAAAALAFRCAPPFWATLASLVVAGLPIVLVSGSAAMSDALFAALAALAAWCAIGPARGAGSLRRAACAGTLAAASAFVRGNGLVLLGALPLGLLLMRRGRGQLAAFAGGVAGVLLAAALLFAAHGAPLSRLLPAGAPEMAFTTLDNSGTWNARLDYERRYSSYVTLVAEHGPEVARAAGRTLWHLHDWWLLPTFSVLGLFVLPGLLLWLRLPTREQLALALAFLAVQASYLWSGRFAQPRHVLAALPLLALLAVTGLRLLPRRVGLGPAALAALPVRTPLALLLVAGSLALGGRQALRDSRADPRVGLVQELTDAGHWLAGRAAPGDRVAASRLNIAYYAGLWPINFTDLVEGGVPDRDHVAAALASQHCRWIAWIDGHSEKAFGALAWLREGSDFPGAELAYRHGPVSLWRVAEQPER